MRSSKQFIILILVVKFHSFLPGQVMEPAAFANFIETRPNNTFTYGLMNGRLIDGSGGDSFQADLLIDSDTIAFIGTVDTALVVIDHTLELGGKVVTPGFIDPHAHGDPLSDDFSNFISMGVTTVVLGQDGRSPVNSAPNRTPQEFLKAQAEQSFQTNICYFAGHGSLRSRYGSTKSLEKPQINQMTDELDQSLRAGCFGLSSGLEYHPGLLADSTEMNALARVVGKHGAILMSHLRSEDDDKLDSSIKELLSQGQHCRVHISHIKSVYGKGPSRGREILELLDDAKAEGIEISADVYPYPASYTGIGIVFPTWAKTHTSFNEALKNRKKELRQHLADVIQRRNGPGATLFANGPFVGKTLQQVAELAQEDHVDILLKLGPIGTSAAYFVMDESLQEQFISHPDIMICSDGGPKMRHPRGYGTHAKILSKYVKEERLLSIEIAIAKMTGLVAYTIGLRDRGQLRVGLKADLLSFDLDQVQDHATYESPFEMATGFDYIFINGKLLKNEQTVSKSRFGRLLRKVSTE